MTISFRDLLIRTVRQGDDSAHPDNPDTNAQSPRDPVSERILAIARTLFLTHGFGRITTDLIAAGVGISKTTLYTRFSSKRDLFRAVISREVATFKAPFDPEALQELPVETALEHIILQVFDAMLASEKWRLEQVLSLEMAQFPELTSTFADLIIACELTALIRFFELGAARGAITIGDPGFAAVYLGALLKGYYLNFIITGILADQSRDERIALARQAARLFVHGIGPV